MEAAELVERVVAGERRALARLLTYVEDGTPQRLRAAVEGLHGRSGHAALIGVTGSPGVGKSTLSSALVSVWRAQGRTVGVLAIDPTSPFSGGALLGDRVRMQDHVLDDGVYVRSMASRGHLGGLSWAAPQALIVLDAAGFDVVLVETVGVGQAEVEIASLADTTVVALAPGMGDAIQAAKAGILEIADVYCVNKADHEGADRTVRELRDMQAMRPAAGAAMAGHDPVDGSGPAAGAAAAGHDPVDGSGHGDWMAPILKTVAATGDGVPELADAIDRHRDWLSASGVLAHRRMARARRQVADIALETLRRRVAGLGDGAALDDLARQVAAHDLDPYAAADVLLTTIDTA